MPRRTTRPLPISPTISPLTVTEARVARWTTARIADLSTKEVIDDNAVDFYRHTGQKSRREPGPASGILSRIDQSEVNAASVYRSCLNDSSSFINKYLD